MNVQFTLGPLNVETMDRLGYQNLIGKLRSRLAVRVSHGVPVLDDQHDPPTRFFDLILQTNRHSVRFRFRSDNLYLLGYVRVDENKKPLNQWLEFDYQNKAGQLVHLIREPGTQFLSFEGSYVALANAAGQSIQQMRVGVYRLRHAIDKLAVTQVRQDRALSLVVVIMMISEATRLNPVFDHVSQGFDNNSGTSHATEPRIEPRIMKFVHGWESGSEAFLRQGEVLGISLGCRFTSTGERIRTPMVGYAEPAKDFSVQMPMVCYAEPSEDFSVQMPMVCYAEPSEDFSLQSNREEVCF